MRLRILLTLTPSDYAWIVLVIGIVVYELFAKDGELMSEASNRYCSTPGLRGWLARLFIFATAAHIAHVVPNRVDPFHWDAMWFVPLKLIRDRLRPKTA
jgi:hypothetical protein